MLSGNIKNKNNNDIDGNTDLNIQVLSKYPPQAALPSTINIPAQAIRIRQEYKQLAPDMLPNELQMLEESIKEHGLYYPIIVNKEGVLLDGHHRFKICKKLGIELRFEEKPFSDPLHEKLFICESAGKRRNLNEWQKVELAKSTENLLKEIAMRNSLANLKQNRNRKAEQSSSRSNERVGDVAEAAAKSAGLSAATYKRARTIIEKGTEEQKRKLQSGKTKINKEYNIIKRQEKREELIKSAQNTESLLQSQKFKIIYGDFRTILTDTPDNSVDLILTDPPYDEPSLPLYRDLALLAKRILKPGGSIICYYGDRLRREFVKYLESDVGLIENCFLHVKLEGPFSRDYERGIVRKQKPMLWYYKGPKRADTGELIEDLIESETPDKDLHEWQQSPIEAEKIISRLTVENQIVIDPMMGMATFGIAALKLNRRFVGIEVNEETYQIAIGNINKFLKSSTSPA